MSSDTRQRMLLTAVRLFRRQGYEQTSMLDVVRESGAPRGSLYHYFPGGKSQLGREAVQLASGAVVAWIQGAGREADSAADFIARLGDAYASALEATGFEQGCPIATVALETAAEGGDVSDACNDGFAAWLDAAAEGLRRHGIDEAEARPLAVHAISAIEGALILSRSARSREALDTVVRQLGRMLSAAS